MSDLSVLVIEDNPNWQVELSKLLGRLSNATTVDVSATYTDADWKLRQHAYDLAIVDLWLDELPKGKSRNEAGLELLQLIRARQQRCGAIVLSGNADVESTQSALLEHRAHFVLQKLNFDANNLLNRARDAIRTTRLKYSDACIQNRFQLSIMLGTNCMLGTQLRGPNHRSTYRCPDHVTYDGEELGNRADNLGILRLHGSQSAWRRELRAIGKAAVDVLESDPYVFGELRLAKALAKQRRNLWLEFSGPPGSLSVPFELLLDGSDYLVTSHVMTRRIEAPLSHKPEPFHTFIEQLVAKDMPLRVLLVCANVDGSIPAVEAEVEIIAALLRTELEQLRIKHDIEIMKEPDYDTLVKRLREGGYHLFHFAGHGRPGDGLSEVSGFVLADGANLRTLDADMLELQLRDTELRLVFASCCFGARMDDRSGTGIFQGVFHALAQADVPYSLGYRWAVNDEQALAMAEAFYAALCQTFSPGDALLEARMSAAGGKQGRDDDVWAAVMLQAQPY
jgi:CheY-like chemotaxis protein